jgi:hypothetical protein
MKCALNRAGVAAFSALIAGAVVASVAHGQTTPDIYGITFSGQLLGINSTTGAATLIGNTGITSCESLERDPTTGQLLMIGQANRLYRVNPVTAAATLIGNTGFQWVESMAYDAATDTMYGSASSNSDISAEKLVTINLTTGVATTVADFSSFGDVDALAISPSGTLFATQYSSTSFASVDKLTAAVSPIGTTPLYLAAMDFAPNGTLFATRLGNLNGGGIASLYVIDPATGASTLVGATGFSHISGLVANVPTPGSLAAIAALGVYARRRRSSGR